MAFIGNTVQNQGFTPAIDYFNGNGVTVTFTLSRPVVSVAQMIVAIDNVIQNPSSAFTVSGNSITFTSAPLAGTNNIWVEYTSLITQYNAISQDPSVIGDITATGGFLAVGDFGNTYTDGTVVDYVTGNARITTGPADGMTFYNGGTSSRTALMAIDSSGNVGIGTVSPATKLHVYNGNGTFESSSAAGNAWTYYKNATQNYYIGIRGSSSNALSFYDFTNDVERMRIDTSGNVGIGTDAPTQKLDALGTIQSRNNAATNDATVGAYNFYNTNASASSNPIRASIVGGRENSNWGAYLAFNTSTGTAAVAERMRLDSSGGLRINATTVIGNAGEKLTVVSDSDSSFYRTTASGGGGTCFHINRSVSTGNFLYFTYGTGLSPVGSINTNGSNTTYSTSSDYRLKDNIAPMLGALDTVSQLKPVTYTWKSTGEESQGFIAHELQAVVPECVTGEKDAVNEDGSIKPQGIDTSFLVATLTAAIQEQQSIIQDLKARIEVLEGNS